LVFVIAGPSRFWPSLHTRVRWANTTNGEKHHAQFDQLRLKGRGCPKAKAKPSLQPAHTDLFACRLPAFDGSLDLFNI
jgi:hypothetical protein